MVDWVALISEHASPLSTLGGVDSGGQNVYVAQVARGLAARGLKVDIFTRRDSDELDQIYEWEPGIRVIHVPAGLPSVIPKEEIYPFMEDFSNFVVEFTRKQTKPYDLTHANFWMSGLAAMALKRELGIPYVVTFHALGRVRRIYQGKDDHFPDERFKIEEEVAANADRVIAECPQDREDLVHLYRVSPAQISTIPCGFDPSEIQPVEKQAARDYLGISQDENIILQLGRMVPRKGVDTAIRGLARLIYDHQVQATLLIVGGETSNPDPVSTPELGRLAAIAREEGVEDAVQFLGQKPRSDLKYFYSAADLFVTMPWYEPFGITPLEAMACGTPVIGSKVGGIKYTVDDGHTGFLVPVNAPALLAERAAWLFSHPSELVLFVEKSIQRVNDNFTWEKVVNQLLEVYTTVSQVYLTQSAGTGEVRNRIYEAFVDASNVYREASEGLIRPLQTGSRMIADCLKRGNKVLVCGNGGSAAESQHFAAELVGRFLIPQRRALPAIALTSDTSILTAWANDFGYDEVFARQVEAYGQPGDLLVGISTSGESRNVIRAFEAAHRFGLESIAMSGGLGGSMVDLASHAIVVPSDNKMRIQEMQLFILHTLCMLVEEEFVAHEKAEEEPTSTFPLGDQEYANNNAAALRKE